MKNPSAFVFICQALGIPTPVAEYRFAPPRRWRLDFAWPEQKLALEVEGGVWTGGRHTRGSGFIGDMEKYNALAMMRWYLLRVTPTQIKSGEAATLVAKWHEAKENDYGT